MEAFKRWHSKQNWLWFRSQNHSYPYSSYQSFLACFHPIIVLTAMIIYSIYISGIHEGDNQHFVTFKDAKPHWRVEPHYYYHMTQELNFTISMQHNIQPSMFKLYQYYPINNNDNRMENCQNMIKNDHNNVLDVNRIIDFSNNQLHNVNGESRVSGILCYTERINYYNYYDSGLVLCNNYNNGSIKLRIDNYNQQHLFQLDIHTNISYIITMQLWINYRGDGKWEGNEINIINIEETTKQFRVHDDDDQYCYGIKVIQDRIVYEIEDGMNLFRFFPKLFEFGVIIYFVTLCALRGINKIYATKRNDVLYAETTQKLNVGEN